jgi:phage baseplate assembly protein gpV
MYNGVRGSSHMTKNDIYNSLRSLIYEFFPYLKNNTHLKFKAKVIKVNSTAGTPNLDGTGERYYSVDIQPLNLDGSENKKKAIIKDVPLDVTWVGSNRGIFSLPKVNTIVRVAYYEANQGYPYIDGILSDNQALPQVLEDELLIQHSSGNWVKFKANGDLEFKTSQKINLNATGDVTVKGNKVTVDSSNIELGGTNRLARLGDTVDVQLLVTYGGFGAVTSVSVTSATINSASTIVKGG